MLLNAGAALTPTDAPTSLPVDVPTEFPLDCYGFFYRFLHIFRRIAGRTTSPPLFIAEILEKSWAEFT